MFREPANPLSNFHGTAQSGRLTAALLPEHISVDERSLSQLLAYAAEYARLVRYYNLDGLAEDPETGEKLNWSDFFEKDETVFLASLLATDIHGADETIQAAFLKVHQLRGRTEKTANFLHLTGQLLAQTTRLFKWYDKALSMQGSATMDQIAREIDRAMRGELGYQLYGVEQILSQLEGILGFPNNSEKEDLGGWLAQIKGWLRGWPRKQESRPTAFTDYTEESFDDFLHFSSSRLQDYYRRLYFTLSYLDEITPELFELSITKKHNHEPDIGLLIAFLRLFSHAQAELNKLSDRHLEYYERTVLGRKNRPPVPDRAVVAFESGNPLEGISIPTGTSLLAGTTPDGTPSRYLTGSQLYISQAKVAALKTLFVSKNPLVKTNSSYRLVTAVYSAPVANSADGKGEPFKKTDHSWPVLGEDQFDLAVVDRQMTTSTLGFAIASSILQLGSGERQVTAKLRFLPATFSMLITLLEDIAENTDKDTELGDVFSVVFNRPFKIFLTGIEGWIPVKKYLVEPPETGFFDEPELTLRFTLPASAPPTGGYLPDVHGDTFTTNWPVLKCMLSDDEPLYAYSFLRDLELEEITLRVAVNGVRNLGVYNDLGLLDASRPFVPFGPLPRKGSYLLFGHPELFSKNLTELNVDIEWGELPEEAGGFAEHYDAYGKDIDNDSFKFTLSALSDFAFQPERKEEQDEFNLFTTELAAEQPLKEETTINLEGEALKKLRIQPLYRQVEAEEFSNSTRLGYFKCQLSAPKMAFGHSLYPKIFAERLAQNAQPRPFSLIAEAPEEVPLPLPPYTPTINRLTVSYQAESVINLRPTQIRENSKDADDRLFRIHPFGVESVYAAGVLKSPYLLPRFNDDGYLYIGLSELHTARPLSLFFDIQDSKKKIRHRPLDLQWHYLHGEEWRPFGKDQIISDSTVLLSTQGVVQLYCPPDMTKGSGLMDADLFWIRISASGNLDISGRCTNVTPHVVEAIWDDKGDTEHLVKTPEEREQISAPEHNIPGLAGIRQVTPFYGGSPEESEEDFYVRGSERLRHKNRAVNVWDYERLILEAFPGIQQVKCIGRHGYEEALPVTGRVLLVVVPKITERDIMPKVGFHVLADIERYLNTVCGPFVQYQVINPIYEPLKIKCSIKLRDKSIHQQGQVWKEIHDAVTGFVCPWLKDGILKLGGSISKTEILTVINENPHVAFTTAFSIVQIYEKSEDHFKLRDTALPNGNAEVLTPSRPWSVLVPLYEHDIDFLEEDEYRKDEVTAIEGMRLGADFVISESESSAFKLNYRKRLRGQDQFFELPDNWLTGE